MFCLFDKWRLFYLRLLQGLLYYTSLSGIKIYILINFSDTSFIWFNSSQHYRLCGTMWDTNSVYQLFFDLFVCFFCFFFCQDMRKFGGPGKLRQKCRLRQCHTLSKNSRKGVSCYCYFCITGLMTCFLFIGFIGMQISIILLTQIFLRCHKVIKRRRTKMN